MSGYKSNLRCCRSGIPVRVSAMTWGSVVNSWISGHVPKVAYTIASSASAVAMTSPIGDTAIECPY